MGVSKFRLSFPIRLQGCLGDPFQDFRVGGDRFCAQIPTGADQVLVGHADVACSGRLIRFG